VGLLPGRLEFLACPGQAAAQVVDFLLLSVCQIPQLGDSLLVLGTSGQVLLVLLLEVGFESPEELPGGAQLRLVCVIEPLVLVGGLPEGVRLLTRLDEAGGEVRDPAGGLFALPPEVGAGFLQLRFDFGGPILGGSQLHRCGFGDGFVLGDLLPELLQVRFAVVELALQGVDPLGPLLEVLVEVPQGFVALAQPYREHLLGPLAVGDLLLQLLEPLVILVQRLLEAQSGGAKRIGLHVSSLGGLGVAEQLVLELVDAALERLRFKHAPVGLLTYGLEGLLQLGGGLPAGLLLSGQATSFRLGPLQGACNFDELEVHRGELVGAGLELLGEPIALLGHGVRCVGALGQGRVVSLETVEPGAQPFARGQELGLRLLRSDELLPELIPLPLNLVQLVVHQLPGLHRRGEIALGILHAASELAHLVLLRLGTVQVVGILLLDGLELGAKLLLGGKDLLPVPDRLVALRRERSHGLLHLAGTGVELFAGGLFGFDLPGESVGLGFHGRELAQVLLGLRRLYAGLALGVFEPLLEVLLRIGQGFRVGFGPGKAILGFPQPSLRFAQLGLDLLDALLGLARGALEIVHACDPAGEPEDLGLRRLHLLIQLPDLAPQPPGMGVVGGVRVLGAHDLGSGTGGAGRDGRRGGALDPVERQTREAGSNDEPLEVRYELTRQRQKDVFGVVTVVRAFVGQQDAFAKGGLRQLVECGGLLHGAPRHEAGDPLRLEHATCLVQGLGCVHSIRVW